MNIEDLSPEEQLKVIEEMNEYSEMFDRLCMVRHQGGQEEYGEFTFLDNDLIRMMVEELADTCNYARYQATKLMILQQKLTNALEATGSEEQLEALGINTFRGAGKAWQDANRPDSTD